MSFVLDNVSECPCCDDSLTGFFGEFAFPLISYWISLLYYSFVLHTLRWTFWLQELCVVAHCLQLVDWSLFVALSCVNCEPLYLSLVFQLIPSLDLLFYSYRCAMGGQYSPAAIARIWSKFWRWMRTRFVKGECLASRRIWRGYQGVCASVA